MAEGIESEIKIEENSLASIPEITPEKNGALSEEKVAPPISDSKSIVIMLLVIIGLFVLTFAGFKIYGHFTAAAVIDIDQLHQENLNGDLNEKQGYLYNGYSFVYVDGLWWTEVNRFGTTLKIPLHFGPKEVENITIKGNLDKSFDQGDNVYMAIDPKVVNKYYTLSLSELSFNIGKGIDRIPVGSCTENDAACVNRTIISCKNSQGKPVIELALSNQTGIWMMGSCIKVSGEEYDLVKAVDRLLYRWYGIMG